MSPQFIRYRVLWLIQIFLVWSPCILLIIFVSLFYFCPGYLLLKAEERFKELNSDESILDIIEESNALGVAHSSLREMTYAAISLRSFPILRYSNEPLSHVVNANVRPLIKILPDLFTERCAIPQNIATQFQGFSHFAVDVAEVHLERSIPPENLIPVDGDGLVEYTTRQISHRLYGVDAPELFSTYYINVNDEVLQRRNGHIAHLGLHYFIYSFAQYGSGKIFLERAKCNVPLDPYGRNISSFWFQWQASPNQGEMEILSKLINLVQNLDECVKNRVMTTTIQPQEATAQRPFLLNLNALLVLAGFCLVFTRYCFCFVLCVPL